ncbi:MULTISPECIES: ABC transporter ATP-binding protein [Clostridium]|uniref:Fluoroquinolones export ATP-binding proteinc n=1 Tax=Clostridium ragsdalei P11 TaxID=1353534 RepID=A0A1A6AV05_9CLOT|nr:MULTISPECIES: ABC transporter ATP-binding protein [Clostridium]OBR93914.1 fluoroquinolones export ATP-binding proteinc [Clostridium ragsdalei P11]QXE17794.1 bacitracin ABC transporter ATP-binding protein [Clostridium sp. 001]
MENIISIKSLRKDFGENTAIKDLTLDVKEGEIFGFLGPSGAGKTTTIKILTCQLLPTGGDVKIFNKSLRSQKKDIFKNIGVLSDNSGLYERLTVEDNLMLFANINGVKKKNVDEILEKVKMTEYRKRDVKKLSKGMKQRLMIARAVIHNPKLLFLDEPTSSLDPGTALEVHKLLLELNREGTTIFLTTHNMYEADKLCHRVAFLNEGEIVDIGAPGKLKLKYAKDDIKVVLRDNEEVTVKNNRDGAIKVKNWMEDGKILSIHSMEPNLEEIFLDITGREL